MSNTDVTDAVWTDKELTPAQQKNRANAELVPFGDHGVTPQTFAAAVDFAKMMSEARNAVPAHLIKNPGACLAVIDLGQKFKMSPYMLATRTYVVNGVLAFDGQCIMAIMNKHMPLAKDEHGNKTRLRYEFSGEHTQYSEPFEIDEVDERSGDKTGKRIWITKIIKPSTRKVKVSGRMEGEADILEYESPTVFNIKNKKSPLWVEDEDQQLRYWASRRWQRAHWPEGLLGIYDPEELAERNIGADNAKLIEEAKEDPGQRLMERLQNSAKPAVHEGYTQDHAHNETTVTISDSKVTVTSPDTVVVERGDQDAGKSADVEMAKTESPPAKKSSKKAKAEPTIDAEPQADEPEHEVLPTNITEWRVHAEAWIKMMAANPKTTKADMNKKWKSEIPLRNDCGVSSHPAIRDQVYDQFLNIRDNLKE